MTPTNELREELTRRGIEYDDHDNTFYTTFRIPDGEFSKNEFCIWEHMDGTLDVDVVPICDMRLTVEQVLAVTLGHDHRNCHNISDFNPVDVFTCSECGSSFKVSQFKVDVDGVLDDETEFEFVPMHCPWCGAKVIDE